MTAKAYAFQKAIVAALKGDANLIATIGPQVIHDRVPPGVEFPYLSIGPSQSNRQDADCFDGTEEFLQIDIWSREAASTPQVKTICAMVEAALHDKTLIANGLTFDVEHRFTAVVRDGDGLTSHGVISFRAEIYEFAI